MLKKLVVFLLLLIFISGCEEEVSVDEYKEMKEGMEYLTSEKMDGRLTGTEGNDLTVKYLEGKFKEIDLAMMNSSSYLMSYPHKFYNPEKIIFRMIANTVEGETIEFKRGIDYLERSGFSEYKEELPYTFDLNDPELENSFIVLKDSKDFQKVFGKAKGVLIVEELGRTLLVDNLKFPIVQITDDTYKKLKKSKKATLEIESIAKEESIEAFNVVGKIPGKNQKEAVVLSAHFDHVGSLGETIYRGAIDNASGTVLLLDIAKKLKLSDKEFEKDIIFVAFNGEESGLQGSYFFTEFIKEEYEHVYNINIDSIYDGPLEILTGDEEPLKDLINDFSKHLKDNDLTSITNATGSATSDHSSFLYNHMNSLSIISQDVLSKIHIPEDTIEEINFPYLVKVRDTITKFIIDFDNKMYKHEHEDTHEHEEGDGHNHEPNSEEGMETRIATEEEKEKLQFDEYEIFEYENNNLFLDHQHYLFDDLGAFKKYYPNFIYKERLKDYSLKKIEVFNTFKEEIDKGSLEVNKVYKRTISPSDLDTISFKYYTDNTENQLLQINIEKKEYEQLDGTIVKEEIMNNTKYYLAYDESEKHLFNFAFTENINGQAYTMSINKGEEITSEIEGQTATGVKTSLTEADVEKIIEDFELKEILSSTASSMN
ncbi:M28 family metallopeptidase [Psychrobacillus sp. FSL K6-1464]|uniref:M28 family metallopeptidase n=1 Tax=Psychrobacillus sp. FSL K6-1464 TaxID=2921545 RepID=UPI0030F9471D